MAFTVKDFWSYINNNTTDKDIVMLHALPDGSGGFSLINMTKEEFFNIASDMTLQFNPNAATDLIIIDPNTSSKITYNTATSILEILAISQLSFPAATSIRFNPTADNTLINVNQPGVGNVGNLTFDVTSGAFRVKDANFFELEDSTVLKFNPNSSSDFILFDSSTDVKLRYVEGPKYLFFDNLPRIMMSDDGSTNEQVELKNDASSAGLTVGGFSPTNGQKKGFVAIFTDGIAFSTTLESTATANLTAEFSDARNENDPSTVNVQYREDRIFDRATVTSGASTDIPGS